LIPDINLPWHIVNHDFLSQTHIVNERPWCWVNKNDIGRTGKKLEENFSRWANEQPDRKKADGSIIHGHTYAVMDGSGTLRDEDFEAIHMCVCEIETP
jgi:hypothetical protein